MSSQFIYQIEIISEKLYMQNKLSFFGHESFHCRSLWLKKGYDFLDSNH
ncbi:MAG: DUF4007 family protein, partial [Ignavibacteriaceae bacterium]